MQPQYNRDSFKLVKVTSLMIMAGHLNVNYLFVSIELELDDKYMHGIHLTVTGFKPTEYCVLFWI